MATTAERVLGVPGEGRPMDDDQIAAALQANRVHINQVCRQLADKGVIARGTGAQGKIVNRGIAGQTIPPPLPVERTGSADLLPEDAVKTAVKDHLERQGFHVDVMWGRERGVDIEAQGPAGRWLIEAKGEVASSPQQVNYFLNALGELVQRMSNPRARYGLALPDNRQYRGLVARLPANARERLSLTVFFVKGEADGYLVEEA